jgi:ABC-type multidrug transport system fused ATPase/permease subunit
LDLQTEVLFQKVLNTHFKGKRTLMIVAHRLSTIMDCSKILAMDQGKLIDFDSPEALLENPESLFASVVAEKNKAM